MARRGSRVLQDDEDVELDMTPMLDVVFILLIFFIVTAVFVKEPGAEIVRPETTLQEGTKPTLLVAVDANGDIWVDGDIYEVTALRPVLERILQENPRAEAMIQGDTGAPIGTVLDVQEELEDLQIETINISTEGP